MLRRLSAIGVLAGLLVGVGVTGASAATTYSSWSQDIVTAARTTSTATATWSASTPYLRLDLRTGALAAGKCVTVFFDWASSGHHDARALRDCKSNDTLSSVYAEPTPTNITGDPQKLAVCYGLDDRHGHCVDAAALGMIEMTWAAWPDLTRPRPCDLTWVRRDANGVLTQFLDPHPKMSRLRALGSC